MIYVAVTYSCKMHNMPVGHIIDESTKKTNLAKAAKITSKNGY